MTTTIIDVSKWQGALNWTAVEEARGAGLVGAVIMRATYGTSRDPQLTRNLSMARGLEVPRGFYHFAYPGRSSAAAQVDAFLAAVGPLQPGEVAALDIEDDPAGRMIAAADLPWIETWCSLVRDDTGAAPLAYMNSAMLKRFAWRFLIDMGCPLWIANYGANTGRPGTPPGAGQWGHWDLWQFTSKFPFAGLAIDASLFRGTPDQFQALGAPGGSHMPTEKDYITEIEQVLKDAGFYPGELDGVAGPQLRQATHDIKNQYLDVSAALKKTQGEVRTAWADLDEARKEIIRLNAANPAQARLDQLLADLDAATVKARA